MWFSTIADDALAIGVGQLQPPADRVGHLGADVLVLEEAVLAGRALARLARARLADVVQQRAQPHDRRRPASSSTTASVCPKTSCLWNRFCVQPTPSSSSGITSPSRPVSRISSRPRDGCGAASILSSSSRIRSADTLRNTSSVGAIAASVGGSIVERQLRRLPHGAHGPQAVLAEARQRIADRADQPRAEIAAPAERIGERARRADRSAMAFIVKSRRLRSSSSDLT